MGSVVASGGYVPWVDVGGERVLLTDITASPASRARYLAGLYSRGEHALCLCRDPGIPMGVARRSVPEVTYYLYPLHRTDPLLHLGVCPHFFIPHAREEGAVGEDVIARVNGKLRVRIDLPVKKLPPRPAQEVDVEEAAEAQDEGAAPDPDAAEASGEGEACGDEEQVVEWEQVDLNGGADPYLDGREAPAPAPPIRSAEAPLTDLRLLLHVLWSEAGLNVWDPRFEGKRWYGVVAARLKAAAEDIEVKTAPLGPLLYVPPPYSAGRQEACARELERFFGALRPDGRGRRWYGYVLGVVREVDAAREDAVRVRFRHGARSVWVRKRLWVRRMVRDVGTARVGDVVDGHVVVVLAQVLREEGRRGPWLRATDVAAMLLADEQTWLPVWDSHELVLLDRLRRDGRRFYRPLRGVHGDDVAAFVLMDRPDRMALEVLPARWPAEKRARRRTERGRVYEAEGQAAWWWDPGETAAMPEVPRAVERKGR